MESGVVLEYSWYTPGHAGGIAFLKSSVGRIFFDYFGEYLFRSDLSNSVRELDLCSITPVPLARASATPRGCLGPSALVTSVKARSFHLADMPDSSDELARQLVYEATVVVLESKVARIRQQLGDAERAAQTEKRQTQWQAELRATPWSVQPAHRANTCPVSIVTRKPTLRGSNARFST
jgi:hypothetical protein